MLKQILSDMFEQACYLDLIVESGGGRETAHGYIVGLSDNFVVLQSIPDWHSDGVEIFPLNRVEGHVYNDTKKAQQEILAFRGVTRTDQYAWIDLSGYRELFLSLKGKTRCIVIEDDKSLEVGELLEINDDHVILKGIDAHGCWISERIEFRFKDILKISVGDEYSRVLREFVDRTS